MHVCFHDKDNCFLFYMFFEIECIVLSYLPLHDIRDYIVQHSQRDKICRRLQIKNGIYSHIMQICPNVLFLPEFVRFMPSCYFSPELGTVTYLVGKKHSCENQSAIKYESGEEWYYNDELHSCIDDTGELYFHHFILKKKIDKINQVEYYYNEEEELHREEDEPAYIDHKKGIKKWYTYGCLHREGDKPAIMTPNYVAYYKDGRKHRENKKPAVISSYVTEYWEDGKLICKIPHKKNMNE